MKIDGGCHCGHITYEAEIDPQRTAVCHCTDCQMLSGTAFRIVVPTLPDTLKLRSGKVKVYIKTGESGRRRHQAFCPECGTPIYSSTDADGPKVYSLRVGTIRQRNALAPMLQIWTRSALPWLPSLGAVPCIETQPAFDSAGGMQ